MKDSGWYLEGRDLNGKPWIIHLTDFPFEIGRGKDRNLTLSNPGVSRLHVCITERKGELFIEDCNSTNGSLLNDRKLEGVSRFSNEDRLSICDTEFVLKTSIDTFESDRTVIKQVKDRSEEFRELYKLTPRESELLSHLVKGISTKEIAEILFISPGTAKNHILKLLKKTKTHSRLELITKYRSY